MDRQNQERVEFLKFVYTTYPERALLVSKIFLKLTDWLTAAVKTEDASSLYAKDTKRERVGHHQLLDAYRNLLGTFRMYNIVSLLGTDN